ncbi:GTP cyclohydrolase I [Georgenia soli]|uniref:GTP cyclohydrolase 1 n=1 Tax=Georgenia soli TaxID=638953 RepID=A0A2A9ERK0_9MICO|nr:GTP cyclohydrolase I FolE [Georgenia soli]PFG40890.1 GTP cyclohydrolase I [Georgenia soli]
MAVVTLADERLALDAEPTLDTTLPHAPTVDPRPVPAESRAALVEQRPAPVDDAAGSAGRIDLARARSAVADLLGALGRDTRSEHLADTPRRVADALAEMLTPRPFEMTTFPNDEGYDELVLVRDVPFHSLCEHHLLPFHGVAHLAYLPGERIVGLSKLARVLEHFSRDLQVQERLTQQVADLLQERLRPRGVGVVLEAEHLCMSLRGVAVTGSRTVTSALRGTLREDPRSRAEFLALVGAGPAPRSYAG